MKVSLTLKRPPRKRPKQVAFLGASFLHFFGDEIRRRRKKL